MTDVITKNGTTKVRFDSHSCKQYVATGTQSTEGATLGLSICLNLTASYVLKKYQNGEGQIFISRPKPAKTSKKTNRGGKRGPRIQKGPTNLCRRNLRITSHCYEQKHSNPSRFITPSYRGIVPDDPTSKRHNDSFLKRLRREKGENIHYCWVAEIQTERQKRTGVRAIHFHILTPETLSSKENPSFWDEAIWVNTNWNQVVANWALKDGRINQKQFNVWMDELRKNTNYNRRLEAFRNGKRKSKPRKPGKTKYLLTPNLTIDVKHAGKYMAKYMSKGNENIIGGLYGISTKSREYLVPEVKILDKAGIREDTNTTLIALSNEAKKAGVNYFMIDTYDDNKILWSREISKVVDLWQKQKMVISKEAFSLSATTKKPKRYQHLISPKSAKSERAIALDAKKTRAYSIKQQAEQLMRQPQAGFNWDVYLKEVEQLANSSIFDEDLTFGDNGDLIKEWN